MIHYNALDLKELQEVLDSIAMKKHKGFSGQSKNYLKTNDNINFIVIY